MLVVAGLVLFSIIITALQGSGRGFLDPDGVNASGARAVVRLLEDQGVHVDDVRTTTDALATASTGTILITEPDRLAREQFDELAQSGADLILVAPSRVDELAPGYTRVGESVDEVLAPGCTLPTAERAGDARVGGSYYAGPDVRASCYGGSLVVGTAPGGGQLVLLGSHAPVVNRHLDQDGNAALALGLLGQHERLAWYRPSFQPPPGAERSAADLAPDWVIPVGAQLIVAALLAAWWRARRLGPVVVEPLPVAVRASETTEGRARLYRRSRSRDHAAAILREAAVRRLRGRLGLPTGVPLDAVIDAVVAHTGRTPDTVADVLAGAPPVDDPDLVRLADTLDELEQEVHTS